MLKDAAETEAKYKNLRLQLHDYYRSSTYSPKNSDLRTSATGRKRNLSHGKNHHCRTPLFAMILCGYGIVRAGIIGKETVRGLVGVVFWLFLPCFIFMKTLGADYQAGINWNLLNAYYLACLMVFLIAAAIGRLFWEVTCASPGCEA